MQNLTKIKNQVFAKTNVFSFVTHRFLIVEVKVPMLRGESTFANLPIALYGSSWNYLYLGLIVCSFAFAFCFLASPRINGRARHIGLQEMRLRPKKERITWAAAHRNCKIWDYYRLASLHNVQFRKGKLN